MLNVQPHYFSVFDCFTFVHVICHILPVVFCVQCDFLSAMYLPL